MTGKILYCQTCGKLIAPEEAEAEDFEALGGEPVCPACLEQADPERKRALETVRASRRLRRVQVREEILQAKPPAQLFPPPGTEKPEHPTSTQIREIRKELADEWRQERARAAPGAPAVHPVEPARPASPAPARGTWREGEPSSQAGLPPKASLETALSKRARLALWLLLIASLACVIGLAALFPDGGTPAPPAPAPPNRATAKPPTQPPFQAQLPAQVPAQPEAHTSAERARQQLLAVKTIGLLLSEQPELSALYRAIARLKALVATGEEPARAAAAEALAHFEGLVDATARQAAREAAESATDLAEQGLFTLAAQSVQRAREALPQESPWAMQTGLRRLQALGEELSARRAQALGQALVRIEDLAQNGKTEEALVLAEGLSRHPEPDFQLAARQLMGLLKRAEAERKAAWARRQEAARAAWPRFFRDFDAALGAGDTAKALELCRPDAASPLRVGGLEAPGEALAGFASDVAAVKDLYEAALRACASLVGRSVNIPSAQGPAPGTLKGVEGRSLILSLDNKAELRLAVERLEASELERFLGARDGEARARFGPALWTLSLVRGLPGGLRTDRWLAEQYARLGRAVPAHWVRRFELERREELRAQLARILEELRKALAVRDPQALRLSLAEIQPLLGQGAALLAPEDRAAVAAAERLAGPGKIRHVVFQNGNSPAPDYAGLQADQIGRYYKHVERTDVDVQHGLKAGAHNDLQRVLLRFDGLGAALGKGRVRKATLELYQCGGEKAEGAVVALFRLKKAWMPDAGTWLHADQRKKAPWQKPGAGGPEDVEDRAVAQLTFNGQKGLWRSWDLTDYVRELAGEGPNLGLLLRVLKDEPQFDICFYPDGDLENAKDPALRPRLVVEVEAME